MLALKIVFKRKFFLFRGVFNNSPFESECGTFAIRQLLPGTLNLQVSDKVYFDCYLSNLYTF